MISSALSALLQLAFVLIVAVGFWAAAGRRERFPCFLGLGPAPLKVIALSAAVAATLAFLVTNIPAVRELGTAEGTLAGDAAAIGLSAELVVVLAIKALVQTSLTEELLFRGVVGRNLIRRWGFAAGNMVQALLFGLMHLLLLLLPNVSFAAVMAVVVLTGIAGWVLGWLNDRTARGSILPGWAAHGAANLTAYLVLAFGG